MTGAEILAFVSLALLGVAMSGLYSGLETGLYTLNPVRLTVRAAQGDARAVRLRRLLRRPGRILTVLLIGTNAASYLATFSITELMHQSGLSHSNWVLIAMEAVVVTPVLFVFGEVLPKDLFRTHTDRWSYGLSWFIDASQRLFTVVLLLPGVTVIVAIVNRIAGVSDDRVATARSRISHLIREGVGAGVLTAGQATLTDRTLSMGDKRVEDVMVGWRGVVTIPESAARAVRESVMRHHNFTRLPVVDTSGRVVGVLSWVDVVVKPELSTRELASQPLTLPPGTGVLDALSMMRQRKRKLAIVEDPATGRPNGLVTLKDLVEPLTGELAAW